MRFDYTNGKDAKYLVSIHSWNTDDFFYYHYFEDAKKRFESFKTKGYSVSLYDLDNDFRKMFKKNE